MCCLVVACEQVGADGVEGVVAGECGFGLGCCALPQVTIGPGTRRSSSSYRPRIWSRGVVVRCDQGAGGSHPPRPGKENTFS